MGIVYGEKNYILNFRCITVRNITPQIAQTMPKLRCRVFDFLQNTQKSYKNLQYLKKMEQILPCLFSNSFFCATIE